MNWLTKLTRTQVRLIAAAWPLAWLTYFGATIAGFITAVRSSGSQEQISVRSDLLSTLIIALWLILPPVWLITAWKNAPLRDAFEGGCRGDRQPRCVSQFCTSARCHRRGRSIFPT